jgi:hypothetical protein
MYSLIDYIFFLMKSCVKNPEIEIELGTNNSIKFSFVGLFLEEEKNLDSYFEDYYKESSNPLVISPLEIFSTLRTNGLYCEYYYDDKNHIEITTKCKNNNVIKFKNSSKI